MKSPTERILKKQGMKQLRAWLDAEPARLEKLAHLLERGALEEVLSFLRQAPASSYRRTLERRIRELDSSGSTCLEEMAELLDHPATSEAYRSIRAGPFWYRALRVSPTLLRSSHPKRRGREVWGERIEGVVNLRAEAELSRELCESLGLEYFHIPVVDHEVPQVQQMQEFLTLAQDRRLLVHCFAGRGRTGLFVACYRIAVQGLSSAEALSLTEKEVPGLKPLQREWVEAFGRKSLALRCCLEER